MIKNKGVFSTNLYKGYKLLRVSKKYHRLITALWLKTFLHLENA